MNDIIQNNEAYEFVVEFDDNLENDWSNRIEFCNNIDVTKTVLFYESYKNVLRYINDDFIVVLEDYRYGFEREANIGALIQNVDNVKIYKKKG